MPILRYEDMKRITIACDAVLNDRIDALLQKLPRKDYPTKSILMRKLLEIGMKGMEHE